MTNLYASRPDNDGDSLGVRTWEGRYSRLRDRPYLLNVGITDRDGDRYAALLDRADAEKLVEALAEHLGWYVEDRDAEAAKAAQRADDVGLAKALVPGTLVRIAHTPMWDRETSCEDEGRGLGAVYGDQLGVVTYQVNLNDSVSREYGVNQGRVVVSTDIDEWYGNGDRRGGDVHVSSLTVVSGEPSGFHEAVVYTPRTDYRVGDTVLIADPAYVITHRTKEGYVSPGFYGRVGVVRSIFGGDYLGESVSVALATDSSRILTQAVDVSSLQNISAEFRAADLTAGGTL